MRPDTQQELVIKQLQRVYNDLQGSHGIKRMFSMKPPRGLYIYGTVGTGKTMLMDLFYDSIKSSKKQRAHFNQYMLDVHKRIHKAKVAHLRDPIKPVAKTLASEASVLCFDEFQVTDIGDAMIMKHLFTELFRNGVVMVTTSNRHPDELYKNGLQRSNFIPFIAILKDHCDIIKITGADYRQRKSGGGVKYFVGNADSQMKDAFAALCPGGGRKKTIVVQGRKLTFSTTCGTILYASFGELCDRPLGAADYIEIANQFDTVLIRDVPIMTLESRNQLRRFIILIDTLYDRRALIVVSAAARPRALFNSKDGTSVDDFQRKTMDDLGMGKNDEGSSLFSGSEEVFAFERTASRLTEMCSSEYWQRNKRGK